MTDVTIAVGAATQAQGLGSVMPLVTGLCTLIGALGGGALVTWSSHRLKRWELISARDATLRAKAEEIFAELKGLRSSLRLSIGRLRGVINGSAGPGVRVAVEDSPQHVVDTTKLRALSALYFPQISELVDKYDKEFEKTRNDIMSDAEAFYNIQDVDNIKARVNTGLDELFEIFDYTSKEIEKTLMLFIRTTLPLADR